MPPVPQIIVTVDTDNNTYEFTTVPAVSPGQSLVVNYQGNFTIVAGGRNDNITVVATLPATATVLTPFDPTLATVTTSSAMYQLLAIGGVSLAVPTYNGTALTGTPLVIAPLVDLTLAEAGASTPSVSFGGQVKLIIAGLQIQTTVDAPSGLFVGQTGTSVAVAPGGTAYSIADVDDGPYNVDGSSSEKKVLVPLVGTINVSSTKKPRV